MSKIILEKMILDIYDFERAFRSDILLLDFSQKYLTDLKTSFTKFWAVFDLPLLRYNRLDFFLERLFPPRVAK